MDDVHRPRHVTLVVMARGGFYKFGRAAGIQFRKARWMWESMTGSEAAAIRAEYGVGRSMAAAIHEQGRCNQDAGVHEFLDGIGQTLAQSVRNELHRFEVKAVAENHPTAFALPGGFIFVAPSLVELCGEDRDELAFVIAHEMAHVIRRHAITRLLSQKALSAASLASPGARALGPWIRKVGLQWLERAYSRQQEFEADELGVLLMRAAGFDPAAATRALQRFASLDQPSDHFGLGPYLSTHPAIDDRILNLRRCLAS